MGKVEDLEKRIAELEAKLEPPPPKAPFVPPPRQHYDPTEGATNVVTPWMLEMARAVPTSLVRDIVKDFGRGPTQLKPMVPPGEPPPAVASTVPIGPPAGIQHVDAIAKGFADREKLEELAKLMDVASKLRGL
jgi:hypothetical protein